jgi:hypothetical protein
MNSVFASSLFLRGIWFIFREALLGATAHRSPQFLLVKMITSSHDITGVSDPLPCALSLPPFAVETAGNILDRDSELTLFFHLPDHHNRTEGFPRNSKTRMKIDFRDGQADLFAVQRYFSDKLLGPDTVPASKTAGGAVGRDQGSGSKLAWLGDDNRMVDAGEADRQFHEDVPLLQGCERVELAFRGRR